MFFYNKEARTNVIHTSSCHYLCHTSLDKAGRFATIKEAEAAGYRLCEHCAPLKKYFTDEKNEIIDFCNKNAFSYKLESNTLLISAPYSEWKIVTDGKKNLISVYRKRNSSKETTNCSKYVFEKSNGKSILFYLIYIYQQDINAQTKKERDVNSVLETVFPTCKFGDIYMAELSYFLESNVQKGFRPVLIVSNNIGNVHSSIATIIPLTSNLSREKIPTHVLIRGCGLTRPSIAMAEQITTIPQDILQYKVGHIDDKKIINMIGTAIKLHLGT